MPKSWYKHSYNIHHCCCLLLHETVEHYSMTHDNKRGRENPSDDLRVQDLAQCEVFKRWFMPRVRALRA